jgi:hypothetical protein
MKKKTKLRKLKNPYYNKFDSGFIGYIIKIHNRFFSRKQFL